MTARHRADDGSGRDVDVIVVGGGFAGLGAAIRLTQAGHDDVVVLERGDEVGGTWRDNTYPGAACDVPSQLYSYSFAPNPNWSRSFSPQPEIQEYIRSVARHHRVEDRFRFGTEMLRAEWDEARTRWVVTTTDGTWTARILVPALGALCEPRLPDIEGIDTFRGEVFHSARWNHDAELTGRRVAVIGTGASAIQIVPELAEQVAHLDVYQRTAPWVLPRGDRAYRRLERLAFAHVPGVQRLARAGVYWSREAIGLALTYRPGLLRVLEQAGRVNIARGITDPALRRAVTPDYRLGCKRMLLSNDWYPALQRDNVELVTDPIARVTETGVVTADGVEHPVDALVVCTGFHVTDSPAFERIVGPAGVSLGQLWQDKGQSAYKGSAVAGFPNLLLLVGPNTGQGHTSMVFVIESQLNYLTDALDRIDAAGVQRFEVRPEVQDRYNRDLQNRMRHSVWLTGGCSSWYLDDHGRNTTLWPGSTWAFHNLTRQFDLDAYDTVEAPSKENAA